MRLALLGTVAVSAGLAVVLPAAAGANARTVTVPVPASGNATVAHVTLKVGSEGAVAKRARTLLLNAGNVPDGVLVLAGAAKGKGRTMTGSVVLVQRLVQTRGRAAAGGVKVQFSVPRSKAQFVGKPGVALGRNVASDGRKAGYCGRVPGRFGHIARLFGLRLDEFSIPDTARAAYLLRCKDFGRRAAFLAAIGASGGDRSPDGGDDDGGGGEDLPVEEDADGNGIPDSEEGQEDINGNGIPDEQEEEENGEIAPVAGGGTGTLSFVPGQPNQVRYTFTLEHPTGLFDIVFPRFPGAGDAVVEKPAQMEACVMSHEDGVNGSESALSCTTRPPGDRTRTPTRTVPAGTQITGVVALDRAPTAGMGARLSFYNGNVPYEFNLTGP